MKIPTKEAGTKEYAKELLEFFREEHPESVFTMMRDKSGWHYVVCQWKEQEAASEIIVAVPEKLRVEQIIAQADRNWRTKHQPLLPCTSEQRGEVEG